MRKVAACRVIEANAKLTLSLRIVGVREDGYHEIDAEMVSISLADELTFRISTRRFLTVENAATGLTVPADDSNLVMRALAYCNADLDVTLRKNIPAGAGLGGGSSDVAAVFRHCGRADDFVGAVKLGADVPFCLRGGRAQVSGIGERIKPLPFEARTFTLQLVPFGVSTPDVYAAWDALGAKASPTMNDLTEAALRVAPELAKHRDDFGNDTNLAPSLAGSGGTWFVEGSFPGAGRAIVHTVPAEH